MTKIARGTFSKRGRAVRVLAGIALCAVLTAGWPVSHAPGGTPPANEYAVKAAFLFHFAKFVDWPPDAFPGPDSPLILCVLGKDPFGENMSALRGKSVNGRPIAIRYAATVDEIGKCHILFISASEKTFLPGILGSKKVSNVLTIGDMEDFGQQGGFVNFVTNDDRIGIEVNLEAVQRSRMKISSKILALAKIVRTAPR